MSRLVTDSAGEASGRAFGDVPFLDRRFPERDRLAAWREVSGQTIAKLDMEPLSEEPLRGSAFVQALPNLTVGGVSRGANRITRTRALITYGSDDVMLGLMLEGEAVVQQEGQGEVTVRRGEAVVWSNTSIGSSHSPDPIEFTAVAIPRPVLS